MKYESICAGIEAFSQATRDLDFTPASFAEIDPAACAVLAHHHPDVFNRGDFTTIQENNHVAIDLLVGGTPCQDFSVAGLRAGMDGARGQLTVEFAKLAERTRPRWILWENVPGILSIDGGRAFGTFLGLLGKLGYGFAYRVLDAQHFGVPQRRRRVFVVGYLGDWRRAAAVLFERHSLSGYPPPRREAGQVAPTIPSRSLGGGGLGTDFDCDGGLVANTGHISHCLNAGGMSRQDYESQTLISYPLLAKGKDSQDSTRQTYITHSLSADGFDASEDGTGRGTPVVPVAICTAHTKSNGSGFSDDVAHTMESGGAQAVAFAPNSRDALAVRRLTPRECERLQGFPDDYTLVPHRGKPMADWPRYKMLGNSMAVPVIRWIAKRILEVDKIPQAPHVSEPSPCIQS